jgi:hypothetical protein
MRNDFSSLMQAFNFTLLLNNSDMLDSRIQRIQCVTKLDTD